jgi:hypothetical protein
MKDDLAHESAERRADVEGDVTGLLAAMNGLVGNVPADVRELVAGVQKMFTSHPVASVASAFLAGLIIGRLMRPKS